MRSERSSKHLYIHTTCSGGERLQSTLDLVALIFAKLRIVTKSKIDCILHVDKKNQHHLQNVRFYTSIFPKFNVDFYSLTTQLSTFFSAPTHTHIHTPVTCPHLSDHPLTQNHHLAPTHQQPPPRNLRNAADAKKGRWRRRQTSKDSVEIKESTTNQNATSSTTFTMASKKGSPKRPSLYHLLFLPFHRHKDNGAALGVGAGGENANHIFQEYTYKKITPCDICSQILRGETKFPSRNSAVYGPGSRKSWCFKKVPFKSERKNRE